MYVWRVITVSAVCSSWLLGIPSILSPSLLVVCIFRTSFGLSELRQGIEALGLYIVHHNIFKANNNHHNSTHRFRCTINIGGCVLFTLWWLPRPRHNTLPDHGVRRFTRAHKFLPKPIAKQSRSKSSDRYTFDFVFHYFYVSRWRMNYMFAPNTWPMTFHWQ